MQPDGPHRNHTTLTDVTHFLHLASAVGTNPLCSCSRKFVPTELPAALNSDFKFYPHSAPWVEFEIRRNTANLRNPSLHA